MGVELEEGVGGEDGAGMDDGVGMDDGAYVDDGAGISSKSNSFSPSPKSRRQRREQIREAHSLAPRTPH